jgi:aminodeoxychorismate lyase
MHVFLNGKIVPEEQAVVSVFDRGFLYGDGLFETIRVRNGKPFRWERHLERMERGAAFLGIRIPADGHLLREALALIRTNEMPDAILRIQVSRGVGVRGYSPRGAGQPTLVMTTHPLPAASARLQRWRLSTASVRLSAKAPLAAFKTCNKLANILARAEAEAAGADEALLLNTAGELAEAASGNLFWIQGGAVFTPPLRTGILPGVTRELVIRLCNSQGIDVGEISEDARTLLRAEGVFLSMSGLGIVEIIALDGRPLASSGIVSRLFKAYHETLMRETV